MKASRKTRNEILQILHDFNESVRRRNVKGVMDLFADHSDIVSIGSEGGEIAIGSAQYRKFLERAFRKEKTYSWKWKRVLVSVSTRQDVAWVAAEGFVFNNGKNESRYRMTAVFEKRSGRNGKWQWVQYHGSEPV